MSDLQIGLIVVGLLVVAGVYLFNRVQEQRHRRAFEQGLDQGQEEALPSVKREQSAPPSEERIETRIEPSMAEVPLPDPPPEPAEVREVAAAPMEAASASAREAPPVREPTVGVAPKAPDIDYHAHVAAEAPIGAEVLAGLAKRVSAIGKPAAIEVREGADGAWRPQAEAAPNGVVEARVALQLADRSGPLSVVQLARFREVLEAAAAELGGKVTFDDDGAALAAANELDAFCAENDVAIGLNIVPQAPTGLAGTKLRALAEASGFTLAADGAFHLLDERGGGAIALASMDGVPFEASSLKMLRSQGITLLLDVPRVGDGKQVFRRMTELARHFAASLDGAVVDDKRVPLNQAGLDTIARQIESIQQALRARGIVPGGAIALRLFH